VEVKGRKKAVAVVKKDLKRFDPDPAVYIKEIFTTWSIRALGRSIQTVRRLWSTGRKLQLPLNLSIFDILQV
jgi:hypothetical protein